MKNIYTVVLADPPWAYKNFSDDKNGAAVSHYNTMSFEDIKKIPADKWAADDSIIALWTTWPKLDEGVDLLRAWRFEYVTGIPWIKTSPASRDIYCGIGFWTQSTSEILLIGRRGNIKSAKTLPVRGLLVGEQRLFYAPRTEKHSRKPLSIHTWLSTKFQGPYLELFATRHTEGWTCVGRDLGYELSAAGISPEPPAPEISSKHNITRSSQSGLIDFSPSV